MRSLQLLNKLLDKVLADSAMTPDERVALKDNLQAILCDETIPLARRNVVLLMLAALEAEDAHIR